MPLSWGLYGRACGRAGAGRALGRQGRYPDGQGRGLGAGELLPCAGVRQLLHDTVAGAHCAGRRRAKAAGAPAAYQGEIQGASGGLHQDRQGARCGALHRAGKLKRQSGRDGLHQAGAAGTKRVIT